MFTPRKLAAAMASFALAVPAWAADTVQLNFEGLTVVAPETTKRQEVLVDGYYNGGQVISTSGANSGQFVGANGPDFNVAIDGDSVFAFEAILNNGTGNFTSPNALALGTGALGLLEVGAARLHLLPGNSFNNGFSFYYASIGLANLVVTALDANDGILGEFTFSGSQSCAANEGAFCQWSQGGNEFLSFGAVAQLVFSGQGVLIDNITIGSFDPSTRPVTQPIPEPSTYALMALGLTAVGLAARRRQRKA